MKITRIIKTDVGRYFKDCLTSLPSQIKLREQDLDVFCYFCELSDLKGNVTLCFAQRKEMKQELSMSTQAVTNSITRLKSINLLTGLKGDYRLYPEVILKSSPEDTKAFLGKKGFSVITKIQVYDSSGNKI